MGERPKPPTRSFGSLTACRCSPSDLKGYDLPDAPPSDDHARWAHLAHNASHSRSHTPRCWTECLHERRRRAELDLQPPAASSGGGPPKQIRVVGPSHGCVRLAALGCFLHLGCNGRHGRSQPRRLFAAKMQKSLHTLKHILYRGGREACRRQS